MDSNDQNKPRKRGMTELTLAWIAERLRKKEAIKEQIEKGEFQVDSEKVARSLLNQD